MGDELLEIKKHDGQGFLPLVSFEAWRVAVLRYIDELHPDRLNSMERHTATDEVFILIRGQAMLVLGGNQTGIDAIRPVAMNIGEVYNVKRNTWHTVILSRDAHIIIVENENTARENSEFTELTDGEKHSVRTLSHEFLGV